MSADISEVKVSDYIADHQSTYISQSLKKMEDKKRSSESHETSRAHVLQSSLVNKNILTNNYVEEASAVNSVTGTGSAMSYFNSLCKQEVSKHKSIIPDIDFTNKYVRKPTNGGSGLAKANNPSNLSPESNQGSFLNQSLQANATT